LSGITLFALFVILRVETCPGFSQNRVNFHQKPGGDTPNCLNVAYMCGKGTLNTKTWLKSLVYKLAKLPQQNRVF